MATPGLADRATQRREGLSILLAAITVGIFIGLAVGTLGGGGSVLAVPVFVYLLGEDVEAATTMSLAVVAAAAIAGGYRHALSGRVCWRHAGVFTLAALPGIVGGTALGNVASGPLLMAGFALVMLAAAAATWRSAATGQGSEDDDEQGHICPGLRIGRDVAAGLLVGFLTGFFGVGGGFIVVPTLAVALAFSIRSAIGTSLAIITFTSILGLIVHLSAGRSIDTDLTVVITAACVIGAIAGARLSRKIPQRTLGRAFAGFVVIIAAYLLVSVALLGGPPVGT